MFKHHNIPSPPNYRSLECCASCPNFRTKWNTLDDEKKICIRYDVKVDAYGLCDDYKNREPIKTDDTDLQDFRNPGIEKRDNDYN